ncbi:hypothetical protein [Thermoflexus sp.]|uniref:hypothetical protein n=1 Tax=Thermoflexus sp. TaxID=1969742 RepID=UPI0035E42EAC
MRSIRWSVRSIASESYKRRVWTTLGPDYSFGYFSWSDFSRFLRELKPEAELLPEGIFPPLGAEDLAPAHPDYPFRILDPIWTFPGEAITPPPEVGIF